ncbi:hypothetical protein PR202_gn00433 [Eleusine coracana subsp. coracana]|uniref:Profilin n=1 Tax=Eleusine coracana subsp. coracana TaxID=191504 RepID=A0AAV5G2K4_ELECO|nr:hypothetical protein PR202_gn00433 [Eleusine coracana subsp. coracana]
MSWQSYVDDHLMCDIDGQQLTSAAIIGLDGSPWAQSPNFPQYKPEEIAAIVKDFDEPGTLAPTGHWRRCVKKTGMALLIGIYDEPMTPGQCNMVVERLGDYLLEQGF